MRLSRQHGYGRIILDESILFYDEVDQEFDGAPPYGIKILAKSRGILSVERYVSNSKAPPQEFWYDIHMKRDWPMVDLSDGSNHTYRGASYVFLGCHAAGGPASVYGVANYAWIPTEANPLVSRILRIFYYYIGTSLSPGGGLRTCALPVSVGIARPLSREWSRKLTIPGMS